MNKKMVVFTCNDCTCAGLEKVGVKVPRKLPLETVLMRKLRE